MLEYINSTFEVHIFEETFSTEYGIKSLRNMTFQYPHLIYAFGTREVWLQDLNNNVKIYYFDGSITGMENSSNVKHDSKNYIKLGLALDFGDYLRIGDFEPLNNPPLVLHKRRIMKTEMPEGTIKSFVRMKVHNYEEKTLDEGIMLHFPNTLIILSLMSQNIKTEIKKRLHKYNVLPMRNGSAVFFWEDKEDKLEMMKLPYDPRSEKSIQKVYEADEGFLMVKSTVIDGEEYIYLVDEPKYMKVLKIEENKVSIYKDYFVDSYFATYADVASMKQYSYCNGMLYGSSGGYILQEKGKEKEFKFANLYFSQYSLEYGNYKFPMCTEEFILFALSPEYNSDYTEQKQHLLLTPPMNSYRIKQREIDQENNHEFFIHFDDKYILFSSYDPSYDENMDRGFITLSVYQLNGEVLQTIKLPKNRVTLRPVFSQSGEFFAVPFKSQLTQEQADYFEKNHDKLNQYVYQPRENASFLIYRIKKAEEYVRQVSDPLAVPVQNKTKEIIQLEVFKRIDVPLNWNYLDNDIFSEIVDGYWDDYTPVHVDNRGNLIFYYREDTNLLMLNDTDKTDEFLKPFKDRDIDPTGFDIVKFGQGAAVAKYNERIIYMRYNENGFSKAKELKHKAMDIAEECDLTHIMIARYSKFLIMFYELCEATTVIVWDTEKDIEHSNFLGRKDDEFKDYVYGTNSKLGFLCFDKYIVDLDICVPIPFMSKKISTDQAIWCQGVRINNNEDVMLNNGTLITPICFKDIYYFKNKSLTNLDVQKVIYYMDKKSVVFDYIDDFDSLKQVLDIFENEPIYYVMLVLEDNEGNSPLKLAIENNSPRIIELILNCLLKLGHFNLSRKMFTHFSTLFKLELRSFEKYLNTCYFVTEQMKAINKIKMPESSFLSEIFKSGKTAFEENIIEHYTCSILDKEFYKKYEVPDKDGNPVVKDDNKIKSNAVAPADRPQSPNEVEEDKENMNLFEDEEKLLNRVSIKGIEFDWIFHGDQAKQFLKDLSNAKNINIFGQDIIRDIVLFQWKYFKKVIIWRLFVPYIIYFIMFCVYTTWLLERQFVEDKDTGPYDIASYVVGSVILLFN